MRIHSIRALIALVSLVGLAGCESLALTTPSIAEQAGIERSMGGRSAKTFATTLPTMRLATLKTFERMGIPLKRDKVAKKGWRIVGNTSGREIVVSLERVTRRTTRMEVIVEGGIPLLGDASTGTEIILQTVETIDKLAVRG